MNCYVVVWENGDIEGVFDTESKAVDKVVELTGQEQGNWSLDTGTIDEDSDMRVWYCENEIE